MIESTLRSEFRYKAVRSSGPGGQHVNKTSTKVEVSFSIAPSQGLSGAEKERLLTKLAPKITNDGALIVQCSESRSQYRNKLLATARMLQLLKENLKVPKPRKKSKPSKAVTQKRLDNKKKNALKKSARKPPSID
ncbi:MAG: alternative ribosome rescue aminoacyl-tRNA hydrolase ArfB [Marinirhabdus sp.]